MSCHTCKMELEFVVEAINMMSEVDAEAMIMLNMKVA